MSSPSTRRPLLGPSFQSLLFFQHQIAPTSLHAIAFLANAGIEDFHPAFLVGSSVGVEINDFAVVEADSESFFDEHVAFFLFCEAGLSTLAAFAAGFLLSERSTIVNELGGVREINRGTRLAG
jgi:hypothetical protein